MRPLHTNIRLILTFIVWSVQFNKISSSFQLSRGFSNSSTQLSYIYSPNVQRGVTVPMTLCSPAFITAEERCLDKDLTPTTWQSYLGPYTLGYSVVLTLELELLLP